MGIVGISGYINSGKDLTGKTIQYLVSKNKYPTLIEGYYDLKEFLTTDRKGTFYMANEGSIDSGWEVAKYATKQKQIASIILGVPVEKFEDQEFKKTYLPKIWDKWAVYHNPNDGADGLPPVLIKYFATKEEADHYIFSREEEVRKKNEEYWGRGGKGYTAVWLYKKKVRMTIRLFLQLLGTEAMRDVIHPQIWVNALFTDYKIPDPFEKGGWQEKEMLLTYPNWIITDCRYENEAQAIRGRGGIIVRVDRKEVCGNNPTLKTTSKGQSYWIRGEESHESEVGLDDYDFQWVIDNNADIPHLENQVDLFLRTFNLLQ